MHSRLLAPAFFRLAAVLLAAAPLGAQAPGEVLWFQKISRISGGGPAFLHPQDQYGRASAILGDVDGDGIEDLAVGALGDDDGGSSDTSNLGAVWIHFLKADGTARDVAKISQIHGGFTGDLDPGDEFGRVIEGVGDLDHDGVPDLAVGSCYDDDGGSNKGALWILFLNPDGTVKGHRKISATQGGFPGSLLDSQDQFGRSILNLGDLDDDGVEDLAVGAIRDGDGGYRRGCVYILFMKPDVTVKSVQKISETQGGFGSSLSDYGEFGFDLASLGDLDGDGNPEIAIASPDQRTSGNQIGAVFVAFLRSNGTVKSDFRITEGYGGFTGDLDYNDEFGACVDAAGDVDGDGLLDLAVGAGKDDDGAAGNPNDRGAVWILFLRGDGTVRAHQKISDSQGHFIASLQNTDRFGTSLALSRDWNGDGIRDLYVGARFDDDGGVNCGGMYLLHLNDGTITPPNADFTRTPGTGPAPLLVSFTDLSTGDFTERLWTFGDGSTSTLQDPTHTYTAPGTYAVSLTVSGSAGTSTRNVPVAVRVDPPPPPVPAFSADATAGEAPLTVTFTDLTPQWVDTWLWSFGDGESSGEPDPTHTYVSPGSYTVSLTATNAGGEGTTTRVDYVTATAAAAPVAAFSADVTSGIAPLAVAFQDASTGPITDWLWEFGDGAASSEPSPAHVYATAGSYDVSLTVTGPGGSDQRVEPGFVVVTAPGAPIAIFDASTTDGVLPLTVSFGDLSTGDIDSWSWDFGDGAVSTLQDPVHMYAAVGTYSVTLVVAGPGGTSTSTRTGLVDVRPLPPTGLGDNGFELQTPEAPPVAPWEPFAGAGHFVRHAAHGVDGAFPAGGQQWLELSSAGTSGALPPSSPGGEGMLPIGGAGVAQEFSYPHGQPLLEFDAAFLPAAPGDWMSVDVTDGTTAYNLFFRDGSSPTGPISAIHGLPMTDPVTSSANLLDLFPSSSPTTRFVLSLQVGSGRGSAAPSFGYLDKFRLSAAATVFPYGCGGAPEGSFTVLSGSPRIGTVLAFGVDNPLGTQSPGAVPFVALSFAPDGRYPCGTPLAGLGMDPARPAELLLSVIPQPFKTMTGPPWAGPGVPTPVQLGIPSTLGLIGREIYAQGRLFDGSPGSPGSIGTALTGALHLTVGP